MKKFLNTFAGIATAFAVSATAAPSTAHTMAPAIDAVSISAPQATVFSKITTAAESKDDQFNFVLEKSSDTGLMMAARRSHRSHRSHSSHASHASHYSSR